MKYRVETYSAGDWKSAAKVYRGEENKCFLSFKRNYYSFPYLLIEDHPNGHDYLICGENYQGQTVVELDTGKRRDFLPEDAKKGQAFCWSEYKFDSFSSTLIVEGCYWACPYEFRFFDFSDPMNGWPEIEYEDPHHSIDSEGEGQAWPEVAGSRIRGFQVKLDEYYEPTNIVLAIKTFERKDNKLVLVSEWVSDEEQKTRDDREEAMRRYDEWEENFRTSDPLYVRYKNLVEDEALSPQNYESHGVCYEGWCSFFKEQETRWCRRIVTRPKDSDNGYTIDLEWAVKTGPIKLIIYEDGNSSETKFFNHSADGMQEAFDYAKNLVLNSGV